jgi:peroxiredoxin
MRACQILSAVVLFLSLAILGQSSSVQKASPKQSASTKNAQLRALPASVLDTELKAVDGSSFWLSNYSGKLLVVNLWATWCAPCRTQIHSLVKLHKQFESQGLEIVGLSTEARRDSDEVVREIVSDFAVSYKIGWATPAVTMALMQGRDAIPQTFVISPSGRIVKRFVGFNSKFTPAQVKEAIEEALNEKSNLPEPE